MAISNEPDSLLIDLPDRDVNDADDCVREAQRFLYSIQRESLYWCAELESNVTITAEYVYLLQILGLDLRKRREPIVRYMRSQQRFDGGWSIAANAPSDVSTTAETYLALRILGQERSEPMMRSAERFILAHGGLESVRIFTRIFFAMFGLIPWKALPALPAEFALLPPQSPANIYSLASWARGTMVPLFVVFHHKPVFALPNGRSPQNDWLDHLWTNRTDKDIPYKPPYWKLLAQNGLSFETLFGTADVAFKLYEPARVRAVREKAIRKCMEYVLQHQETSGDWGGIFPPMINGILALVLEGYSLDSEPVSKGLQAIENFSWEDETGFRIQACVSPVWDTALSMIALLDCGNEPADARLAGAAEWLGGKQIRRQRGDWKIYRPHLAPGGWSFEYHNTWYPDIDDTAVVLLALIKQKPERTHHVVVDRAVEWLLGMQNRDGGWAAFDVNNNKLFLNKIPFSDMDSLCDESSPDVTGRVLEAFGLFLRRRKNLVTDQVEKTVRESCFKALAYLKRTQKKDGSWFGRWGVNYVYGTSNVLCGLSQLKETLGHEASTGSPTIARALDWLESVQNPDGGWGESLTSYKVAAFVSQPSTPSQTAWSLMGLLAFYSPGRESVERGIRWLIDHQVPAPELTAFEGGRPIPAPKGRTWNESEATGTGFPQHFYLRYHLYRHYFPMMALGRYQAARDKT